MDWLDLLAVQGTLKSLLQHHSPKVSVLQCSASFIVQLSHPYMTTGKNTALTRWTFAGKVMSLLFKSWKMMLWKCWFQIGKGVRQGCILPPCLFNFYAEYIMRNAGLEEAQTGIMTAGRNINNLRYADDTTLMAEREEELKSFLIKVKVEMKKLA